MSVRFFKVQDSVYPASADSGSSMIVLVGIYVNSIADGMLDEYLIFSKLIILNSDPTRRRALGSTCTLQRERFCLF